MISGAASGSKIFVRQLRVKGFRSLIHLDVHLGSLTVLVGFNASGKSNVLDALRFVADSLRTSAEQAVSERGGLEAILYHSSAGAAKSFSIELELGLRLGGVEGAQVPASYSIEIGPDSSGKLPLLVFAEHWTIGSSHESNLLMGADVPHGSRLRLPARAAEDPALAVLETTLQAMRFYDLHTGALRRLDESTVKRSQLGSTGHHLGQVLGSLAKDDPAGKRRVDSYLSAVIPGALGVDERKEGRYSTVEARFGITSNAGIPGSETVEVFPRESLSEGTLRAAGVLAALAQLPVRDGLIPLIGIEEPETALHPANVGALYEALDDAAQRTQVIVTTQSSALLDNEYASLDHLRVVESIDGATVVGEIDQAGREIVEQGLMTLSELHASGQMRPAIPDRRPSNSDSAKVRPRGDE